MFQVTHFLRRNFLSVSDLDLRVRLIKDGALGAVDQGQHRRRKDAVFQAMMLRR